MTFLPIHQPDTLAVVPIFVNAGTALLPAILAPLAAAAANIFRPRELVRIIRANPMAFVVVLAILGLAGWGGYWLFTDHTPKTRTVATESVQMNRFDWSQWAQIQLQSGAVHASIPVAGTSQPTGPVYFRSNAARTGSDGSAAPLHLKVAWTYNPDDVTMYLSSPTVYGDKVYAASCLYDVTGIFGTLYCLDAPTGQVLWKAEKFQNDDLKGFFSSPALTADGRNVVIGQGLHDDKDSYLVCYNALTGQPRWRVPTPLHIESSPAIHGDIAVAGAGAIEGPDHRPTSDPGFVLAVRISDGKLLWRQTVNDPESSPVFGPDGTVYIGSGFNGNAVVALRSEPDDQLKAKGLSRVLWKTPAPYPMTGAITLVDGVVYAGGGNCDYVNADPKPTGVVMALDAKTGDVRWQKDLTDSVLGPIAAVDGKLICPVRDGRVIAMNAADGRILWQRSISGSNPILAGCAVSGEYVYAVSRDGVLAVLKLADGSVLETHSVNDAKRPGVRGLSLSSPTIAGGILYVGSETGGVRAFGPSPAAIASPITSVANPARPLAANAPGKDSR